MIGAALSTYWEFRHEEETKLGWNTGKKIHQQKKK